MIVNVFDKFFNPYQVLKVECGDFGGTYATLRDDKSVFWPDKRPDEVAEEINDQIMVVKVYFHEGKLDYEANLKHEPVIKGVQ